MGLTNEILLTKSIPDECGLKVRKLWNSALFGAECFGASCIKGFLAMVARIRIWKDRHVERAERSLKAEDTRATWLYPGKIPERLRLVKK